MKNKAWQPWIAIYTERSGYDSDVWVHRAILKYNEGGDPDDVHIRNGLWSDWGDDPLMPYTDLTLRCQASPERYGDNEGVLYPYGYEVLIHDAYAMNLRRMERQIKVLRKFARDSKYGNSGSVTTYVQWVSAIMALANFVKAQGFVLVPNDGWSHSWDQLPERYLLPNDTDAPVILYNAITKTLMDDGFILSASQRETA